MLIGEILTSVRCGKQLLDLSSPVVMGVLNITSDSFFAPSRLADNPEKVPETAAKMLSEGAKIIDVGGMSSRPGAAELSENEELARVIPVIQSLHEKFPDAILSVDTYRAKVAGEAVQAGATIINDISGGSLDPKIWEVAASHPVSYVLMHMRGKPENMQNFTDYQDVISEILKYFVNKLRQLHDFGIRDIIIDPGFGFSKTMRQNYRLIDDLRIFRMLGYPVMVGVSRKSSVSKAIDRTPEESLEATTALHSAALLNGASILRVHDVQAAIDTIAVVNKLREAKNN